jgi:hypothetical protein
VLERKLPGTIIKNGTQEQRSRTPNAVAPIKNN